MFQQAYFLLAQHTDMGVSMIEHSNEKTPQHGGFRKGSGRKSRYEKTIVKRVPEKYVDAVIQLIKHLDDCEKIDKHFAPAESEPVFIRSLQDKPQQVTFTVKPIKRL